MDWEISTVSANQKSFKLTGALLACIIVAGGLYALYRTGTAPSATEGVRHLYHDETAGPPVLDANAEELQRTHITPHLEYPIKRGENVLWCATFQIAWNELCKLSGGPVLMANVPKIVPILNKQAVTGNDLDEASYIAMAGLTGGGILERIKEAIRQRSFIEMAGLIDDKIIERIDRALDDKFHGQATPDAVLPALGQIPPGLWVTYCYLFKQLPFRWDFDRLPKGLTFRKDKVQCFGIDSEWNDRTHGVAGQVRVRDYRGADDFVIELTTESRNDRLILAKVRPDATLAETIATVNERLTYAKRASFIPRSTLMVPVLNFDLMREFTELYAGAMRSNNPDIGSTRFGVALQQIRFRLDESGAVLKSEAAGGPGGGMRPKKPQPLNLIFDKPFLIMIQRIDRGTPYFALWVDNAELLVPFE